MITFHPLGFHQPVVNDTTPTAVPWSKHYRGALLGVYTQLRKSFDRFPKNTQKMLGEVITERLAMANGYVDQKHPYAILQFATASAKYTMLNDAIAQMNETDLENNDPVKERAKAIEFLNAEKKREVDVERVIADKAAKGDDSPTDEWTSMDNPNL